MRTSPLRYLVAYCAYGEEIQRKYETFIGRHQLRGFDVEGFCVTPPTLNHRQWLPFYELERRWERKDPTLLSMYEALEEKLRLKDIFIVFNGANVHPDFLRNLSTYNVYMCWDDPEFLTLRPGRFMAHFDYCFTGNASCIPLYQSWVFATWHFYPFSFLRKLIVTLHLRKTTFWRDIDT